MTRLERGQAAGIGRNAGARRGVILAMFRTMGLAACVLIFASASLVGLPTLAAAHHPKPAASAEHDSFSFNGTVTSVDYATNVVELTSSGRRVTIVVEPTTAIDIAGQPGSESDIRPGVKVHAEGVVRDGTFFAQTITIRGGGKPKH